MCSVCVCRIDTLNSIHGTQVYSVQGGGGGTVHTNTNMTRMMMCMYVYVYTLSLPTRYLEHRQQRCNPLTSTYTHTDLSLPTRYLEHRQQRCYPLWNTEAWHLLFPCLQEAIRRRVADDLLGEGDVAS